MDIETQGMLPEATGQSAMAHADGKSMGSLRRFACSPGQPAKLQRGPASA